MNTDFFEEEPINVWKDRDSLPRVSAKYHILLLLICVFSSAALPLALQSEGIATAVTAVLFGCIVLMARTPAAVTPILVSSFLVALLTASMIPSAVLLALIVGIGSLAMLLTLWRLPYPACLLVVLGMAISLPFVKDWRVCLLALVCLPAGICLAVATRLAWARSRAVSFAMCGLLLTFLLLAVLWIRKTCGSLDRETVLGFIEQMRSTLINLLIEMREGLLEIARADQSEQAAQLYDQISQMLSDSAIRETVASFFNFLPAIVTIFCSIVAFEAQLLLGAVYRTVGWQCVLMKHTRVFAIRPLTAVVYAVTFLLMLVLPASSMAQVVVGNICLILLPGLCIVGSGGLLQLFAKARGGMRTFLLLTVAFLLCCSPGGMFYILAMWGAYTTVIPVVKQKISDRMNRDGEDGDDF